MELPIAKNFVYVSTKFDPLAIKIVDAVTFRNRKKQTK